MANMDETLTYLNMPTSTTMKQLDFKKIRTQGQENWRITVILTIFALEENLAHLLIIKANEGKILKKITVNRERREKRAFVFWQKISWIVKI